MKYSRDTENSFLSKIQLPAQMIDIRMIINLSSNCLGVQMYQQIPMEGIFYRFI